jgi:hypothetical protein
LSNSLLSPPLSHHPLIMGNHIHHHHNHDHNQYNQLSINNRQNTNTPTTKSTTTTTTTTLPSPLPKYPKTSQNETTVVAPPVTNNTNANTNSFSFRLDTAYIRHIQAETRRFSSMLTQSDIECKSVMQMNSSRLAKNIIEICQMSTTHSSTSPVVLQARINKIRKVLRVILNVNKNKLTKEADDDDDPMSSNENEHDDDDDDEDDDEGKEKEEKSFYDLCLHEACVQLCQLKPTLLTRGDDLIRFGKRILQNCSIVDIERQNEQEDDAQNKKVNASPMSAHVVAAAGGGSSESSQLANARYFFLIFF